MRMLIAISLVAAGFGLALVGGKPAYARTRTPTATPTVTSTPTPTPWPTPTPTLPPEQVAKFSGDVWLEAFGGYGRAGMVTAMIGDTVCGEEPSSCAAPPCLVPPASPPPHTRDYHLDVVPAEAKPGCGYEGAPVTFYVGTMQATATAVWHAGASQEVNLTAGPAFAFFRGELAFPDGLDESIGWRAPVGMYALIGDNVCGRETRGVWKGLPYYVVVYSDEQQAGCGTEGAQVTFALRDRQEIIGVAREKGVWHAWGVENVGQELDLTMDPVGGPSIKIGNVGTGERHNEASSWQGLPLALAMIGLAGIAAGVALRRRA